MTGRQLPLTVVGGFLGAGKTTLLNHWLDRTDQRLAVLVNDFGALDIDARLIRSRAGDVVALTNGCVCCQIGDDLTMALIGILDSSDAFDAVVIEASGVSDPWRIAQMGRADPGLRLDSVIVLVDASAALKQARDPLLADTLVRQLMAADLVVVNKCDLVAADERADLRAWIRSVAGPVPQFETTRAAVPLTMLGGLALSQASSSRHREVCDGHPHHDPTHAAPDHGAVFDTWSFRPTHVYAAATLRAWLREPPAGLLRLKGVLRTGASEWSEIQFAGRHGGLRMVSAPADGAALVAIGLRGHLPEAALNAAFLEPG